MVHPNPAYRQRNSLAPVPCSEERSGNLVPYFEERSENSVPYSEDHSGSLAPCSEDRSGSSATMALHPYLVQTRPVGSEQESQAFSASRRSGLALRAEAASADPPSKPAREPCSVPREGQTTLSSEQMTEEQREVHFPATAHLEQQVVLLPSATRRCEVLANSSWEEGF